MNNNRPKPVKISEVLQIAILSVLLTAIGVGLLKGTVFLRDRKIFAQVIRISEQFEHLHNILQIHYKNYNYYPKPPKDNLITPEFLLHLKSTIGSEVLLTISDPFNKDPYKYYSNGLSWYLLLSTGPDRDYDLKDEMLRDKEIPNKAELQVLSWDSTNGLRSGGDIFSIGPYSVLDATQ